MQRALDCIEGIALLAVSVLCIVAAVAAWRIADVAHTLDAQLPLISVKFQADLDEAHRLTLEAGLTAMEARKASAAERAALPALTFKTEASLDRLNELLASIRRTSDGIGISQQQIAVGTLQALAGLRPVEQQSTAVLGELHQSAVDLDKLAADPDFARSLANTATATGHLAAAAADVQQEVHSITHPTWLHRIWGWTLDVAHVFNPLICGV